MRTIHQNQIEITAPRSVIWDALADINNYHQWNSVVPYGQGFLRPGNTINVSIKMPSKPARLGACRVNEVKPGHYFVLSRKLGFKWMVYMEHSFILHSISGKKDHFRFMQTLEGSGIMWSVMAKRLEPVWNRFQQMNLDLKNYVEKTLVYGSQERLASNKAAF